MRTMIWFVPAQELLYVLSIEILKLFDFCVNKY